MNDLQTQLHSMELATGADLLTDFARHVDASPRTVDAYRRNVGAFLKWIQARGCTRPTWADVLAYREERMTTQKPTTVQAEIIAIKQFFKWTEAAGLYPNVARDVKTPKASRSHKRDALTQEQARKLLAQPNRTTLQGKRDYAIMLLMVTGGLRDTEVMNANIGDYRELEGKPVLYVLGKGHTDKDDPVKLTPPARAALQEYLDAKNVPQNAKNTPIFTSLSNRDKDTRLTTRSISRIVKKYLIKAGMDSDRLTAHSLRHTAVTAAVRSGATLEQAQQFARHEKITTTMIYLQEKARSENPCEDLITSWIFDE